MNAIVAWLAGFLRIVWVCRVGVVNTLVGLLFFGLLVQAQNLMADLSSWGSGAELVFWAGVFGFAFLLWAFPVHYGARRSIDQLARLSPAIAAQHPWLVALLPRLLGLLPFAALVLGIKGAREQAAGAAELLPATAGATMTQGLWLYGADAIAAALFVVFVCVRRRVLPPRGTAGSCIRWPFSPRRRSSRPPMSRRSRPPSIFPARSWCRRCSAASCWARAG